jgi:sugar phosphate isomerase/epimerase
MPSFDRTWSRRDCLHLFGLAALAHATPLGAADARRLAIQLYTVRALFPARTAETLEAIAAIGYKDAEILRGDAANVVRLSKAVGITPVSMHVESALVTGNWAPVQEQMKAAGAPLAQTPDLARVLDEIRSYGISYAVVAYLMPSERGKTADDYKKFADQLNAAGTAARKVGVTLGYHNHAFEFAKLPDGQTAFDVMVSRCDPALVTFEVDLFWASVAGRDPAVLLDTLTGRVALVHVKDKRAGTPTTFVEQEVPRTSFGEVGAGTLDFKAILAAARRAGVKHYVVEQDQTPGDPLVSIKQSYQYLQTI